MQTNPELNNYLNYREYLRDFYNFKRESGGRRPYSYSVFAAAADIKSPNYLKLIIDGRRNLSSEMAGKFAKALQLTKKQSQEFSCLVRYGQEDDALKRNQYLRDLAEIRVEQKIENNEIRREDYEKVPDWVAWVLYTMVDQRGVDFSAEQMYQLFRGRVSQEALRRSLAKLVDQKQLVRQDGQYRQSKEKQDNVPVSLVRKLQAELNGLGMESLFKDSPVDREFGSLTLALTKEEFEQYRFELRQLRKRIHKETAVRREKSKGERIYQVNLQLFPLTDSVGT